MNAERFRNSPSGRLVQARSDTGAHWAFVPHALPPRAWVVPGQCQLLLSDADTALGGLVGLVEQVPNPMLLIAPMTRREAVSSSRIEGTTADFADLAQFEGTGRITPGRDDVREVSNYRRALHTGENLLKRLPVCTRLARQLHQVLLEGVRGGEQRPGELRRRQVFIGPPGCSLEQATFVPPPVEELEQALLGWENYANTRGDFPPLVRAALIHYQFEAIHPFLDGNGRVGRLLIIMSLLTEGRLRRPVLYLSPFFERTREQYYGQLLAVSERGAWSEWVEYFLRGVVEQSGEGLRQCRDLLALRDTYHGRLTAVKASPLALRLADLLFEEPVFVVPHAAQVLGVTYRGAQKAIGRLVEVGILRQVAAGGRHRYAYIADDIQRLMT
jgi:Fic family protein